MCCYGNDVYVTVSKAQQGCEARPCFYGATCTDITDEPCELSSLCSFFYTIYNDN